MWYMHYFDHHKDISAPEWSGICCDVIKLLMKMPAQTDADAAVYGNQPLRNHVVGSNNTRITPQRPQAVFYRDAFGEQFIHLNGDSEAELDGGVFVLGRTPKNPSEGACCNTKRKPYDLLVCAILIVANHHAPESLDIRSQGQAQDWIAALDFVQKTAIADAKLPPKVDPGAVGDLLVHARRHRQRSRDPSSAILRDNTSDDVMPDLYF